MEEGLAFDTDPRRSVWDRRGGNNGTQFLQSLLEGPRLTSNLRTMAWSQLGLGGMAHHLSCYLQHHDPDLPSRAYLSSDSFSSLAVAEVESLLPWSPCLLNNSRVLRFSIQRISFGHRRLRCCGCRPWLDCKENAQHCSLQANTSGLMETAGPYRVL